MAQPESPDGAHLTAAAVPTTPHPCTRRRPSSPSLAGLGAASASPLLSLLLAPAAEAATSPVASAGAAYGHYLCLLLMVASLTVERCTVNEKPTKEDITTLLVADSVYGIAGIGMIYTGYLRVAKYAKGWEFYQHEPLFWTKMFLFGVVGSASLFCTASIIRMQIAMTNDGVPPELGAKLTKRMRSIINAELTGFLSIPFVATLMARGVSYNDDFDWHLGAGLVAVGSLGATAKYVKEALSYDIPGYAAAEEKYAAAEAK